MFHLCYPPSRAEGTRSYFVLPGSSIGMPRHGPRVQWQDLPCHCRLLFRIDGEKTPHHTDQHRVYQPDKEYVCSPRDPRHRRGRQRRPVQQPGLFQLCFTVWLHSREQLAQTPQANGEAEMAIQTTSNRLRAETTALPSSCTGPPLSRTVSPRANFLWEEGSSSNLPPPPPTP